MKLWLWAQTKVFWSLTESWAALIHGLPPSTIAADYRNLEYDLIITGRQAIDGDTAQVGPQISEHLAYSGYLYAQNLKVEGDSVIVERQYEDRYHVRESENALPDHCSWQS